MKYVFLAIIVVAAIALAGMFITRKGYTPPSAGLYTAGQTVAPTTTGGSASPTTANANVRTIDVSASAYSFEPAQINVRKGETVRIVLTSTDLVSF